MIGQTLQIKRNTFFVEKKATKQFPNSIITFFLIMQFIYGYNFGFIDVLDAKIRHFCKVISLLVCLCTGVILLLCTPLFQSEWDMRTFWGSLFFTQYSGHIVLLHFSKYKVHNFLTELRSIDDGIVHSKEHKIGFIACIIMGYLYLFVMVLVAVICVKTISVCMLDNKHVNAIYMICVSGLDAIVVVQLVVNLYTYYAVVYLAGLVDKEEVSLIRKQFLRISECCEKFGKCYGNLVSI